MLTSRPLYGFVLVILLGSFLFFFKLGDRSFRNPDEGRYAEIAREMAVENNWIEPKLYGMDYLRKPPLFYWLVALSFKLWGATEFTARLVPAFFGVLGIAATFLFAQKAFGPRSALFSSLMLLSNVWYVQVGRYLLIDSVFAFFLVSAFYLFILGLSSPTGNKAYAVSFYVCVALAFLAKGLAGIVIPFFCLSLYLGMTRQLKKGLSFLFFGWGPVVFAGIVLPWFILISRREPEFLKFFFLHEHFSRFVSKDFEHQAAWYYYLLILPAVFLPWVLFVEPLKRALGFLNGKESPLGRLYPLTVSLGIVVFYSLSRSKLATYILPCIPLLCVWLGHAWAEWPKTRGDALAMRATRWLVGGFLVLLGFVVALPAFPLPFIRKIPTTPRVYFQTMALSAILILSLVLRFLKVRRTDAVFYSIVFFTAFVSFFSTPVLEKENTLYTTRDFAEMLRPLLKENDRVLIYGDAGAFYDFGFYLKHPVKLANLEGELKLPVSEPDTSQEKAGLVSYDEFVRLLKEPGVYCLIRKSDYWGLDAALRQDLKILKENDRKVLFESLGTRLRSAGP